MDRSFQWLTNLSEGNFGGELMEPDPAVAGIRSALSVPLVVEGQEIGSLEIYATEPRAFTGHEVHLLNLLAGPVAVLLGVGHTGRRTPDLSEALRAAVADQDWIERVIGVLMGRRDVPEATARTSLLDGARDRDGTLAQTADHLLEAPGSEA